MLDNVRRHFSEQRHGVAKYDGIAGEAKATCWRCLRAFESLYVVPDREGNYLEVCIGCYRNLNRSE